MERVVDKIRKLLRLAKDSGASEHEAASALAKAQELMLRHNIEHIADEHDGPEVVKGNWCGVKLDDKWHLFIAAAIAKLYNCRNVINTITGSHRFVGKSVNVEACEVTFEFVIDQVLTLYKEGLVAFKSRLGRLSKAERADFRQTFKEACASRIWHRVNVIVATARNQIPDHMALVVIDQSLAAADDMLKDIPKGKGVAIRDGLWYRRRLGCWQ